MDASDIIERLRDAAQSGDLRPVQSDLFLEALDEIERLRNELAAALRGISPNRYWEGRWRDEKVENERLQAEVALWKYRWEAERRDHDATIKQKLTPN